MKILFVTGSLVHGGAERHTVTLLNRLAARGHECHAVFIKDDRSQIDRLAPGPGGTVTGLAAERFFDRIALGGLAALLTRLRPDAVVAANDYAMMYASLARWLAGVRVPLLVTFHTTKLRGLREQVKMMIGRALFPGIDCLAFVSSNQARHWRRRGVWARRIEVIHNGVDPGHFTVAPFEAEAAAVRQRFGIGAADYLVGMLAVMRPEKNHVQLLDAIAALRAQGIAARALLIGDGPTRRDVEWHAQALGIASHVSITGFQQEVRPFVAACDAVALCSLTEAFSLAAIEAMAMGKPVVHAEVGGAAEMIADGHNGYLFPVGDTEALRHRLALLSDGARARSMGRHARHTVEARFSETAMVDRYERLLEELGVRVDDAATSSPWDSLNHDCKTRSQST